MLLLCCAMRNPSARGNANGKRRSSSPVRHQPWLKALYAEIGVAVPPLAIQIVRWPSDQRGGTLASGADWVIRALKIHNIWNTVARGGGGLKGDLQCACCIVKMRNICTFYDFSCAKSWQMQLDLCQSVACHPGEKCKDNGGVCGI